MAQTSIEWLIDEIEKQAVGQSEEIPIWIYIFIEQAKEMHKQEIIDAYGNKTTRHIQQGIDVYFTRTGENYYNETFNK
jgi:hypothetical protein